MATRPATSLYNAIKGQLERTPAKRGRISIARRTALVWLQWAKAVDARRALDGSKKNKHRRVKR